MPTVEHDVKEQRFRLCLGQAEAFLDYRRHGDILDFVHVYVPPEFRGRGIAGQILVGAFDYARRENFKVIPSCPYVSGEFLPRSPQYQDLVAEG